MSMDWKFFAVMGAGMMESAGFAKENEDENTEGADDVIGEGLVYASHLVKWLAAGAKGKKPVVPDSLK